MTNDRPVADLHVHTTASDGTLTVEELPSVAREAGVEVVAVTDHDRFHPALDAPVVERDGLTVVHGVELRVDAGDLRVDLLGYGVRRTPALAVELDRIQRDRRERARRIIDCLESHLDVSLALDPHDGIGRPHIARAIDESEADYDYRGAFAHLIGSDGPCYVSRNIPGFDHGVRLLSEACAVVSLAHPFRYPDPAAALGLTDRLDAVERNYPYGRTVDTAALDRVVAANDLLITGGSDAHNRTLGRAGLDRKAYAAVAARLPDS